MGVIPAGVRWIVTLRMGRQRQTLYVTEQIAARGRPSHDVDPDPRYWIGYVVRACLLRGISLEWITRIEEV